MEVEVLGSSGCKKCSKLKEDIETIVNDMEISNQVTVSKVEDPKELAKRGIMSTPAVIVDDEVKFKGRVPSDEEIKKLFR